MGNNQKEFILGKLEISDSKTILEVATYFKLNFIDLGEDKFKICIKILEKMIFFKKKKEMYTVILPILEDGMETLKGDKLIFWAHTYVLSNNYLFEYKRNVQFYNKFIKNTDMYKSNIQYAEWLFLNISLSFKNLKDYPSAIEVLNKASQVRVQLAVNYELNGDIDKAIEIYEKIIKKHSSSKEVTHSLFNLFTIYKNLGKEIQVKKYLNNIEEKFLLTEDNNYKVTRCLELYKYYNGKNRVKSYRYLRMATFEYEAILDIDIKSKLEALRIAFIEKKFKPNDIFNTLLQYKEYADNETKKVFLLEGGV